MNIIIVDDSRTKLTHIQICVEEIEGVATHPFSDPHAALIWCENNDPDLVIIDYMMPEIDGIEFVRRFRRLAQTEHVPVLMVTSTNEKQVLYDALQAGANDFLRSPIDQMELIARARTLLKIRTGALALLKANEQLFRMAMIDDLTQVYNRRRFIEQLEAEIGRARRHEQPLALAMLDIDHFKKINDTHGHAAGDIALKHVARLCVATMRPSDFVGRLGGEEFAICLPATEKSSARAAAERLCKRIATTAADLGEIYLPMTASIGITEIMPSDTDATAILTRADEALYRAKHGGRNRVEA